MMLTDALVIIILLIKSDDTGQKTIKENFLRADMLTFTLLYENCTLAPKNGILHQQQARSFPKWMLSSKSLCWKMLLCLSSHTRTHIHRNKNVSVAQDPTKACWSVRMIIFPPLLCSAPMKTALILQLFIVWGVDLRDKASCMLKLPVTLDPDILTRSSLC